MPPGMSRLERGGCDFLQGFQVKWRSLQARNPTKMMGASLCRPDLCPDGGAEGVGERLAEAVDIVLVFGFDHDAGKLLGAGVAQDDAAIVAERGFSFGEGARN